jgi:hypothetical protein
MRVPTVAMSLVPPQRANDAVQSVTPASCRRVSAATHIGR